MTHLSKYALGCCILVMFFTATLFHPKWNKFGSEATLSYDVSGYYLYLPAIFIYKDLYKLDFKEDILKKYAPTPDLQQAYLDQASGNYVIKYACGQAIAMLPWFGVAHAWAKLDSKYPPDGFSFPYQICIGLGMFLYSVLGLIYLRLVLLTFFKDSTVALLLLSFVLGTNYLNWSSIDQGMTHSSLFVIYVLLIWNTIAFHKEPKTGKAILVGLLCGWATLIRPTEVICILIPLFWGINNLKEIKERWVFLISNKLQLCYAGFVFVGIVGIQLLYWKAVTGHWWVYSYQNQGFNWLHPYFYEYLLSYRFGWWRYCPLMVLPFLGLIPFWIQNKSRILILLFSLLSLYMVAAWEVWDYGGNSGRAMVQYYPILAFPLCALIELVNKKMVFKLIFYPVVLLCAYISLWWTYNARVGQVQVSDISKAYYNKMVGRWHETESDIKLLDNNYAFEGKPKNEIEIYANSFDFDASKNSFELNGAKVIRLNKALPLTNTYLIGKPTALKKWIRVSADFSCIEKELDLWNQAQFILVFSNNGEEVQTNAIRVYRFLKTGETKTIYLDAIPPKRWDQLRIQLWNVDSDKELYIDNLKAVMFDE